MDITIISNDRNLVGSAKLAFHGNGDLEEVAVTDLTKEWIMENQPDIILFDLDGKKTDVFPFLMNLKAKSTVIRWILFSSVRDEAQLYQALKMKADDFLKKPASSDAIAKAVQSLGIQKPSSSDENSRWMFIKRDLNDLDKVSLDEKEINLRYATHFRKGRFKAIILKMDRPGNIMSVFENNPLRDLLSRIINDNLAPLCHDVVHDRLSDGILAILNYDERETTAINEALTRLFNQAKERFTQYKGISLTLCVSREYSETSSLPEAKAEVLDNRWARMQYGTNRILNPGTAQPLMQGQTGYLKLCLT